MNFRGMIFIYAAIIAVVFGCSWFQSQPTAPVDEPPIQLNESELTAACVLSCMVFEFTSCQAMDRAVVFGQVLEATQEAIETVTETVDNLTDAQIHCTAKCLTLADSLAQMANPEELPFECLAEADDCEVVNGCFE